MGIRRSIKLLLFKMLPIDKYLKLEYKYIHNSILNLDDPKKFTEKLYWLKIYNGQEQKKIIQFCYDKYNARKYISDRIGEQFLPKLYGVYDSVKEIDFDNLPKKCVIKITQSNGSNILINGRTDKDMNIVKGTLNGWLNEANDFNKMTKLYKEESYYYNGKARIICEEYLENNSREVPSDVRFFCFNGEPKYITYDLNSVDDKGVKKKTYHRNTYDLSWNLLNVDFGRPSNLNVDVEKPLNLDKMIDIASVLAKDFVFVRVDFYNIEGRIVVGELTWIPMGGGLVIKPIEFDYKLGKLLELPHVKLDYKNFKRHILNRRMF